MVAWINPSTKWAPWIVGLIILAMFLPVHVNLWNKFPAWYHLAFLVPLAPLVAPLFSAHVMGGCAMGPDPRSSVARLDGRHHHVENVYIFDGSLFPTSVGANPQLSIYAIVSKLASALAASLKA